MRRLHSFTGLVAALVVSFMAITGAILSLQPALEAASAHAAATLGNVAQLASQVATSVPGLERITRSANGMIVAYYKSAGGEQAAQIDPVSGAVLGPYEPSGFFAFITELHRSLFFGDAGRGVAGVASLAIVGLAISGVLLLVSKMGGWRQLFGRTKGELSQRLHTSLARVAVFGLTVTSISGAYMSGYYFGLVPDGSAGGFSATPTGSGGTPAPTASLEALTQTSLTSLRELVFPVAGKLKSVFTLTTDTGVGYVDQSTGSFVKFTANNLWQQVYETIYMLHTGQGAWWLGILLGLAALAVPALAITGVVAWFLRRRQAVRLRANSSWRTADTVLLYGTETNSTLGFAASVHDALVAAGHHVHTAPMNSLQAYPKARRILILTSTYGNGTAPSSAKRFLGRLDRLRGEVPPYAVLGFGDRSFPGYCAFATQVNDALSQRAQPLLVFTTIDRQSDQDFAAWTRRLGEAIGNDLVVTHTPVRPRTSSLVLTDRQDYGVEVQAPIAVLRFTADGQPRNPWAFWARNGLPRFRPGDLVGIVPPGSNVPRYYSLASSTQDSVLEIAVRKQAHGLCSEFLHGLRPGDTIEAFIRPNPEFHPARSRKPMILVGAGTGLAPLAGFVRHNHHRPAYLYFGARDPGSDFLFREPLEQALSDRRLTALETAFSRVVGGGYVQDRLQANGESVRQLIKQGAEVFVCGGLEMAQGVRDALDLLLAPIGLSAQALKLQGRYFEDAY